MTRGCTFRRRRQRFHPQFGLEVLLFEAVGVLGSVGKCTGHQVSQFGCMCHGCFMLGQDFVEVSLCCGDGRFKFVDTLLKDCNHCSIFRCVDENAGLRLPGLDNSNLSGRNRRHCQPWPATTLR